MDVAPALFGKTLVEINLAGSRQTSPAEIYIGSPLLELFPQTIEG
jgi:hypothetical protein